MADSGSSDEEPVNGSGNPSVGPSALKRGRPSSAALLHQAGPPTLVALVSVPGGRWWPELNARNAAGATASRALRGALGSSTGHPATTARDARLVGFAVLKGWQFVHESARSIQTWKLMMASLGFRPRAHGQRFLEHMVLAAAALDSLADTPAISERRLETDVVIQRFTTTASEMAVRVAHGHYDFGQEPVNLGHVLATWEARFGVTRASIQAWRACPPLAVALSLGLWPGDVSAVFRRQPDDVQLPSTCPPRRQLSLFVKDTAATPTPPVDSEGNGQQATPRGSRVMAPRKGSVHAFDPGHLIRSLQLGQSVANQGNVVHAADHALQYWYPDDFASRRAALAVVGARLPGRHTLVRSRIRLDIAAMLHRREWFATSRPALHRYLSFDASPQSRGVEVLVTVERVVTHEALLAWAPGHPYPAVEVRRLPISVLGHGRCGLADKAQAHIHQCWLEYGPSSQSLRAANACVRECLSDMGTELGIADHADVVDECIHGQPCSQSSQHDFLYPLALGVPGPQHILDGVLRDTLDTLDWWPSWQAQAKVTAQWLNSEAHRQFLQQRLREHCASGSSDIPVAQLVDTLGKGCDRFVAWRWKTLANVTRDLLRMEDAVRAALATIPSAKDLGSREEGVASQFLASVRDSLFWDRARGLGHLVQPLHTLSAWIRGCDCHPSGGDAARCHWKGCRARAFGDRLRVAEAHIVQIRGASTQCTGLSGQEVIDAATHMLSVFRLKFEWVHEPPFLIWQADSPDKAAQFIAMHDALVLSGGVAHRVSEHFCGSPGSPGSPSTLRRDMDAHASGHGMTDALRAAIASYQLSMLDDTWAEAVHRDLTAVAMSRRGATIQYKAATMRLHQNLDTWANAGGASKQVFEHCLRQWKSIARPGTAPLRKRLIVVHRTNSKSLASLVYRLSAASLINWSARLRRILAPTLRTHVVSRVSANAALKADYLGVAIRAGRTYSLPLVRDEDAERARSGSVAEAWAVLEEASGGHELAFDVIATDIRKRKLIRTAASQTFAAMVFPAMIQRHSTWASRGSSRDVYPDGTPEVIDLAVVTDWAVLRAGLREWRKRPSDTLGCHLLTEATLVSQAQSDIRGGPVSVITLLEQLSDDGWAQGRAPAEHAVGSPRILGTLKDPTAKKAYLQCLCCLSQILSDTFPALPSGQLASYYACVLQTAEPESVAAGQPGEYYRRALLAIQSGGRAPAPAAMDISGDATDNAEEAVCGAFAGVASSPAAGAAQRDAHTRPRPSMDTPSDALWRPLPTVLGIRDRGAPLGDQPGSSTDLFDAGPSAGHLPALSIPSNSAQARSSSHGSRRAPVQPAASHGDAPVRAPARSRRNVSRDIVAMVDGVPLVTDVHLGVGQPGHYSRLVARCPLHSTASKECAKKRNCGPAQTARLGHMEPAGYLGAWLEAGASFTDRESHMAFAPGVADTQQCMLRHGWPQRGQPDQPVPSCEAGSASGHA